MFSLSERMTRRHMLSETTRVATGGAGIVMGILRKPTYEFGNLRAALPIPDYYPTPFVVESVKERERDFGNRELGFEEARDALPDLAVLFSRAIDRSISPRSLLQTTYILHQTPYADDITKAPKEEVLARVFNNFQVNYPDVPLTDQLKASITDKYGEVGGWAEGDRAFFVLETINGKTPLVEEGSFEEDQGDNRAKNYTTQYAGYDYKVVCTERTPIVALRSVANHEWMHNAVWTNWRPLNLQIVAAFLSMNRHDDLIFQSAATKNFHARFIFRSRSSQKDFVTFASGFNEFVNDFHAARVSMRYDLPFSLSYGFPNDHVNFAKLLAQSGVSPRSMFGLYKEGDIDQLFIEIADAADPNKVSFEYDWQKIRFVADRIPLDDSSGPNWGRKLRGFALAPFYKGIEAIPYYYRYDPEHPEFVPPDQLPGCIY